MAVDSTGQAWANGENTHGELGIPPGPPRWEPMPVPGVTDATSVAAGATFGAALRSNGHVVLWGSLAGGQPSTPVDVPAVDDAKAIVAGADHLLILHQDGTVSAVGGNAFGQLGDGTQTSSAVPVPVVGLSDVVSLAAGASHSLALDASGRVFSWGSNTAFQLGLESRAGPATLTAAPVPNLAGVRSIAAGARHSLAARTDGSVVAWGDNSYGQVGDGTQVARGAPVQVLASEARGIAAGSWHSLVVLTDGRVFGWGANHQGQLGAGPSEVLLPRDVQLWWPAQSVAAGSAHSSALSAEGLLFSWGGNEVGQLGVDGTTGSTEAVVPLGDVTAFAASVQSDTPGSALPIGYAARWYGYDALGSVRHLTGATGNELARYAYDAFGQVLPGSTGLGGTAEAYLYRGERFDPATGLYHLRARDYDPGLGRFRQIDTFDGWQQEPQSLNRYAYADANPVGKSDPTGRYAITSLVGAVYAMAMTEQLLAEMASLGADY